jgi:hypothetical protein
MLAGVGYDMVNSFFMVKRVKNCAPFAPVGPDAKNRHDFHLIALLGDVLPRH